MEMRMDLSPRLEQRVVMTQRLQQALKLLELPSLELSLVVKQQLEANPALEVDEELEEEEELEEREEGEGKETGEGEEETSTETDDEPREEDLTPADDEVDWADLLPDGADGDYRREERERGEEPYQRLISTTVSFREHLESQLRLATDDPEVMRVGEFIIGSLDDRGYLTLPVGELAQAVGASGEQVEHVLRIVQGFDPPGIGGQDLRECLLLQLEAAGEGDTVAARVVRDHLDDLLQKRFAEIARRAHLPLRDIQVAVERIGRLDPRPGTRFSSEPPPYVTPDLVVDRVEDEFVTYLNDRDVPRVRISPAYRQVLREARERRDGSREFLSKKMDAARWLIDIIEQRRRTMLKVMREIVEFQRNFFEHGLAHLKPMTLQQVAERIGMHESTVSRVTRSKYVQTPHGVFELKYFFSTGLPTDDGGEVSARNVKLRLQELVTGEDARRPLSDQQLVDLLRGDGYRVARRTVAKYREQLAILPARMRRQP